MIRIFAHADYDFIGFRYKAIVMTIVVFLIGVVALTVSGIDYSIEFNGGTLIRVKTEAPINVVALRAGLEAAGIKNPEITPFGGENEFNVRARTAVQGVSEDNTSATTKAVAVGLDQVIGVQKYTIMQTGSVGPKVASDLKRQAFLAIFLSFFAVLAYLAWRFEWRFGLAAVLATFHDIVLTICFIATVRIEVSLVVVAAVLSMVGYSLNDTIIIFDRVRENLRKSRRDQLVPVLNRSINETLPRSVLTHTTTLATLAALAVFGGPIIRPFALVMFFGVFTGTFSSVFIAAPALLIIEHKWPGMEGRGIKTSSKPGALRTKARPA